MPAFPAARARDLTAFELARDPPIRPSGVRPFENQANGFRLRIVEDEDALFPVGRGGRAIAERERAARPLSAARLFQPPALMGPLRGFVRAGAPSR